MCVRGGRVGEMRGGRVEEMRGGGKEGYGSNKRPSNKDRDLRAGNKGFFR